MSIARALSNAVSGLAAVSRGTETVAANLANLATPGYARRDVALSPLGFGANSGGVRVNGIMRIVDAGILGETRLTEAARSNAAIHSGFAAEMEAVVGVPGNADSLASKLTDLQSALVSASTRPEDEVRLQIAVSAAEKLADKLNEISNTIQAARTAADNAIAADVEVLNGSLDRVADLNRRIATISAKGADPSSLMDQRQQVIDQIARIVPVQEVVRDNGHVALFTTEGAVLLDGSQPNHLTFQPSGSLTPEMSVGTPPVGILQQDGRELTVGGMGLFVGGSLAASFAVRDELAPQMQVEIDTIALELHDRFALSTTDPTLDPGEPGLFTDAGGSASLATLTGLSGRITINETVQDELWRLRAGIGADNPGPIADSAQLLRLSNSLTAVLAPPNSGAFNGNTTLAARFSQLEAITVSRRVASEADTAIQNSRHERITSTFLSQGVDSDFEMQRLLQYEQAYAANARVIQAIDEMMQSILRL